MRKLFRNKNSLIGLFVIMQIFSYILYLITNIYTFLFFYFLLTIPMLFFFYKEKFNLKKFFLFIFFPLLIFMAFSFLSKQSVEINFYNLLYFITSTVSAYVLYKMKDAHKYVLFLFLVYTAFIYYYFFRYSFNPDIYNQIFSKGSRNYVSAIYIIFLCLLILTYDNKKINLPIIYPLLTFLGCIFLYGRSGIVVSFSILLFLLFSEKKYILIKSLFIVILFIFIYLNIDIILTIFSEKTSFVQGAQSPRSIKNFEYINNIYNSMDLFFGRDLNLCCPTIVYYNYNPHNSFITGHLRYGISHTIFSISIFLYVLLSKKILHIFLITILYFRYSVDLIGLFTPLDITLFYLLFSVYEKNNIRH